MPLATRVVSIMIATVVGTAVLLVVWLRRLHGTPRHTLPLQRMIDPGSVTGIDVRYQTFDPTVGRRLLHQLGSKPAILIPHEEREGWYVWSGRGLTVTPLDTGAQGGVMAEFTVAGAPRMARAVAGMPRSPQGLRELPGDAVALAAIRDPTGIRMFATLEEATAAARIGPGADGAVDHIVGGAAAHPAYYLVSVIPGPAVVTATAVGSSQQRVWVRIE